MSEVTGMENLQLPYKEPEKPKLDFSDLYKSLAQAPVQKPQYIPQGSINLPATTGADSGRLFNLFSGIDNMSDQDLYNLVVSTYDAVLSYGRQGAPKEEVGVIWNLFNNVKYVMCLSNVLNNTQITYDQRVCCNKIIYDYMISSKKKNPLVQQALDALASTVNKDVVTALSSVNLPQGSVTAAHLAVCAYSSQSPMIGVKRMNLYMINSEDDTSFNEDTILHIYENMYCSSLTILLEGIMFDEYSKDDLKNLSENARNIYYIQNLAIIDILEQAPTAVIMQVLNSYALDFYNFGGGRKRFSFVVDPIDYARINSAIELLKKQGVYVP